MIKLLMPEVVDKGPMQVFICAAVACRELAGLESSIHKEIVRLTFIAPRRGNTYSVSVFNRLLPLTFTYHLT